MTIEENSDFAARSSGASSRDAGRGSENRRPSGRVTSREVAALAGVSKSTVSRTFTPGASASPETRRRVIEAAAQLGYRPNILARSLTKQKTGMVGILVGDFQNPLYLWYLRAVTNELRRHGLQGLVFNTSDPDSVAEALALVLQFQVDGLLVTSTALSLPLIDDCRRIGTPIVAWGAFDPEAVGSGVACNNYAAGLTVAQHLIDLDKRNPAYIGAGNVPTSAPRLSGFQDGFHNTDRKPTVVNTDAYSYESGVRAMHELAARQPGVDAVFCADDNLALGAMDAARYQLGLSVPGDLAVVGFDDLRPASWPTYSLTTVRQPVDKMVAVALDMLAARIGDPSGEATVRLLEGELVVRGSTRPA